MIEQLIVSGGRPAANFSGQAWDQEADRLNEFLRMARSRTLKWTGVPVQAILLAGLSSVTNRLEGVVFKVDENPIKELGGKFGKEGILAGIRHDGSIVINAKAAYGCTFYVYLLTGDELKKMETEERDSFLYEVASTRRPVNKNLYPGFFESK